MMLGDILLFIGKILHQQVFCIHSYRTVVRKDLENIPYSKYTL